jgi:uncharacterized repeat protein (TIGR02543 family)
MKKTFFAAVTLSVAFAVTAANAQAGGGWLSRYWDGCKPSCSWSGKQYNGQGQCKECDKNNNKINTSDGNRSSCDGGTSYTCWDMSPWAVDNTTAYGFAAAHNDNQCGTCWQLTFNGRTEHAGNGDASVLNGKKLTVMISNIGGDVQGNQLDFLVPGGGVGAFDSFSGQINVSSSALGERYGGLVSAGCQGNPTCLKGKCDNVFGGAGKEWLKAGCYFYADWMGAVGNPQYTATKVDCPAALTDRWKNAATGTPGGGTNPTPTPTPSTYTLTTNLNPSGGGTVSRNPNATSYNSGTQVTVTATPASGYTFTGWSGASTSTNASVTVTMNGNLTLTANFQSNTFTLSTNVSPAGGGTVSRNPNSNDTKYNPGTQVTVTATAAQGYTFTGWSGASTATTASVTINMNADRTLTANFQQNTTGGGGGTATYTLTTNINPAGGGTVSRNPNAASYNSGTQVTVTATPASGYTFTGWSGASTAATQSVTVTMNGNQTLTANFQQAQQTYTLTTGVYPASSGSVSRSPAGGGSGGLSHAAGSTVTLTATPASGYTFVNWTGDGVANATNATTTVSMTANRTVTANFQQQGGNGGGNTDGTLDLTIIIVPAGSGRVDVTPQKSKYQQSEPITVTAVANAGYTFNGWDADDFKDSEPTHSTNMWWHRTITASFNQILVTIPGDGGNQVGGTAPGNTGPGGGGSVARTDTAYIEAEDYASKSGAFTVETTDGVTNIGYIENGHSATYKITVAKAGAFTLGFRMATGLNNCAFAVTVNGAAAGTVTSNSTGGWDAYRMVFLPGDINLNVGENTIVLNFQTSVNIDYLILIGESGSSPGLTPVRYSPAAAIKARAMVTLKPTARGGFTASLPAGHGFTTYRVLNLQGREVKSGRVGGAATDLSVGGLKNGVFFLRLEGKGQTPLALKVVTY